MQTSPNNWDAIHAQGDVKYITRIAIKGISGSWIYFDHDTIISVETAHSLIQDYSQPIGNCIAGEIDLEVIEPSEAIPTMAEIRLFVKARSDSLELESGWAQQGRFWIDTRETVGDGYSENVLRIHGYDAMLKSERDWSSTSGITYPATDTVIVNRIASLMGVTVDSRTSQTLSNKYSISLAYLTSMTCRQILSYIAIGYAGNWTVTKENALLLLSAYSYPLETNLLTDEDGEVLEFSDGTCLIVS